MKTRYPLLILAFSLLLVSCGLNNTMYNARKYFKAAQARPLNANGMPSYQAVEEYTKTIQKCGIIITEKPNSRKLDDVVYLLARALYYKANSAFQAKDQFEALIKGFPNSKHYPEAHIYLARVLRQINRPAESEAVLEGFVRDGRYRKYHPRALLVLAEFEIEDKDYIRTQYWLQRIIDDYSDTPEFKEAFFLFGKNFYEQKDYASSLSQFEKFVKTRGITKEQKMDARYYIALNHFELGELEKSSKEVTSLLRDESRPEKVGQIRVLKARILMASDKPASGVEEVGEIYKAYPRTLSSSNAYYYLGEYYFYRDQNITEAITNYNKVKTDFPSSTFVPIAQEKVAALNQIKENQNLSLTGNLQQYVDYHLLAAENYLNTFALPDSALLMYDRILDAPQQVRAGMDSLNAEIAVLEAKADSLQASISAMSPEELQADTEEAVAEADSTEVGEPEAEHVNDQGEEVESPELEETEEIKNPETEEVEEPKNLEREEVEEAESPEEEEVETPATVEAEEIKEEPAAEKGEETEPPNDDDIEEAESPTVLETEEIESPPEAEEAEDLADHEPESAEETDTPSIDEVEEVERPELEADKEVEPDEDSALEDKEEAKDEEEPATSKEQEKPHHSLQSELQRTRTSLASLATKIKERQGILERLENEFLPQVYFTKASLLKKLGDNDDALSAIQDTMQAAFPENKYTNALGMLIADEPVRLIDPEEDRQTELLDRALGFGAEEPDSMRVLLEQLVDSNYPQLALRANFRLGWMYSFEVVDTTLAKPYLNAVLDHPQGGDYATWVRRFYNGKKYVFPEEPQGEAEESSEIEADKEGESPEVEDAATDEEVETEDMESEEEKPEIEEPKPEGEEKPEPEEADDSGSDEVEQPDTEGVEDPTPDEAEETESDEIGNAESEDTESPVVEEDETESEDLPETDPDTPKEPESPKPTEDTDDEEEAPKSPSTQP
ncbi:MAG TPA: tetratricopeptide repeat protein [Candidatus Cloacimonadota bacterium]|nr:tetratricopeptide repeat protein [Candidatus Cloacimonadota bacterium]